MNKYQKIGLVLALGLGFPMVANSSQSPVILYNTLDPFSYPASGEQGIPPGWIANAFTTGTNCPDGCLLGNITLKLSGSLDGNIQGIVLQVLDATGVFGDTNFGPDLPIGAPGTAIGPALLNPSSVTSQPSNNVFLPNTSIVLAANTSYWVKIDASAPNAASINWSFSALGPGLWVYDTLGDFSFHGDTGPFLMQVAATPILGVGASAVPVPAAAWLMGSGLIGLVSSWRRKKSGLAY